MAKTVKQEPVKKTVGVAKDSPSEILTRVVPDSPEPTQTPEGTPIESPLLRMWQRDVAELQDAVVILGDKLGELNSRISEANPTFSTEQVQNPLLIPIMKESIRCCFLGVSPSNTTTKDKVMEARARMAVDIAKAMLTEVNKRVLNNGSAQHPGGQPSDSGAPAS